MNTSGPSYNLQLLWYKIRAEFFPERSDLDDFTVHWSKRRQKRVLASISIKQKKVNVAKELEPSQFQEWLEPLLYHEMCHAVIGEQVEIKKRKRQWHGAEFKNLEQAHPKMTQLERWIKSGGWLHAVRSERTRSMWINKRK